MKIFKAGPCHTAEFVEECTTLEEIEWGWNWIAMMNSWLDLPEGWQAHPEDYQGYYFAV